MYIPKSYAETDIAKLHDLMRAYNFAVLFSAQPEPLATHLPFLIDPQRGPQGTLICHMARANPHWQQLDPAQEVLVVFQGPHSYISPLWYANPSVVPTWNYAAVHAYGKPRLIHEPGHLRQMVMQLVAFHESPEKLPDFDANLPENLLQAIVGVEIEITRLEGKFKFNQNKSVEDQQGVIDVLSQSADSTQRAVAQIMRANVASQPV
jgi:transcriptional regulator